VPRSFRRAGWLEAAIVTTASTALAAIWLSAVRPWGATVPGLLGDNVAFVWNTWWAGRWVVEGVSPFHTTFLFAPWGTSLVLHSHAILPSVAAAILPGASAVAATNTIAFLHLTLNFLCAYALAERITGRPLPSALAAVAFGWSPYVGAHLAGHFNLIAAWVLPLFLLLLLRALAGGRRDQLLLGIVAGTLPYVDYYYAVYAIGLGIIVLVHRTVTLSRVPPAPHRWQRRLLGVCAAILAADLLLIAAILLGAGRTITIGGLAISVRGIANPVAAAGLLVMVAAAIAIAPGVRLHVARIAVLKDLRRVGVSILAAAILILPLGFAVMSVWQAGAYVSQTYLWRSAPGGVDAGTLVLGNPNGALWTAAVRAGYERLHINAIECVAWLSPGIVALCIAAFRHKDPRARLWTAIGLSFGVWALGPRLEAFGKDLHVYLPAVLLRYVPLAANARMPGRAMVVVYLAAAMIAAIGADSLISRGRRGLAWAFAGLLVIDLLPAAPAAYRPDHPAVYDTLAHLTVPGSVCELPMGLRDGFGETGRMDMRVLYYQTIHQRPITGGFVARLDPRLVHAYQDDPVLGVLLRLSGGGTLAAEHPLAVLQAGDSLLAKKIKFVMVNEETATSDLLRYVSTGLPLHELGRDGRRVLYEVAPAAIAALAPPSLQTVRSRRADDGTCPAGSTCASTVSARRGWQE
jgi:hypothetical protein